MRICDACKQVGGTLPPLHAYAVTFHAINPDTTPAYERTDMDLCGRCAEWMRQAIEETVRNQLNPPLAAKEGR